MGHAELNECGKPCPCFVPFLGGAEGDLGVELRREVPVVMVLCGAGMTVAWLAVIWRWVVTFSSLSAVWVKVVCTPRVHSVFCARGGKMCYRWSSVW